MQPLKNAFSRYRDVIIYGILAVAVGAAVGVAETLFGMGLELVSEIRDKHIAVFLPFLPLAGVLIVFAYTRIGKNSIKGMSLLFSVRFGEEDKIPARLIPLVIVSTWITHLFGGSAGREGVAVQIGGAMAHQIGRRLKVQGSSRILLITGMAAGFAGLFQTPLAAIFFALEVFTAGFMEYAALFPCVIAAFVSCNVSRALGFESFKFELNVALGLDAYSVLKTLLLGVAFGVVGGLFAYCLNRSKKFFGTRINNPILRVFAMGCALSILILLLHKGRYAGSGTNLIGASLSGGNVYPYDWILESLLTILTMSAGFQGGEMVPLFSIGASLGAFISPVLGMPSEFAAALGFVAVFSGATNTILAPVFIGGEVFGYEYMPYFFIVSAAAYIFNGNKSIYPAQRVLDDVK